MAVAIRGDTPAVTATTANPISLTLDGTRQPQVGDLLLIFHGNDFYLASNMPTPSVGGSTAGVTAITNGSADAGTNGAHVKAYYRVVSAVGDLTVSVTETGSADEDKVLVAYVLSGVDTDSPVDGGSAGAAGTASATSTTSQPAPSVTPTGADALLVVHNNSGGGGSTSAYTPPAAPYVETYDAQAGGISYTGGVEQLSASGATGTRTITAANSVSWAAVSVAVKTAGATVDEGTLAGTLPALTGAIAADASASAALASTLPGLTADVAGTGSADAQLAAQLPALTGTLSGDGAATAAFAASLPTLTGEVDASAAADAALAATLPALTGTSAGTASGSASLASTLPPLSGETAGQASATITLTATLPALVGLFAETPKAETPARGPVALRSTTSRLRLRSTTSGVTVR